VTLDRFGAGTLTLDNSNSYTAGTLTMSGNLVTNAPTVQQGLSAILPSRRLDFTLPSGEPELTIVAVDDGFARSTIGLLSLLAGLLVLLVITAVVRRIGRRLGRGSVTA
jgi:hypothetical protein